MLKINLKTRTLCVQGEDLTAFYKLAEAINALGSNIHAYMIKGDDLGTVETVHVFKNPYAHVIGNWFMVEEKANRKRGGFAGMRDYMTYIDGYEITDNIVKYHSYGRGKTVNFEKL